jgi:hypothetical protein
MPGSSRADLHRPAAGQRHTLGEVRALKPDDEPLDPAASRPVRRVCTSRDWSEPPSPEQVSIGRHSIMMGVVKGVLAAGQDRSTTHRWPRPDPVRHRPATA